MLPVGQVLADDLADEVLLFGGRRGIARGRGGAVAHVRGAGKNNSLAERTGRRASLGLGCMGARRLFRPDRWPRWHARWALKGNEKGGRGLEVEGPTPPQAALGGPAKGGPKGGARRGARPHRSPA